MIECQIKGRGNSYDAVGIYDNGKLTVLRDSIICKRLNKNFKITEEALTARNNPEFVDENGKVLMDIQFGSASTAAQFVTGNSTNGLRQWKNRTTGKSLKESL